MLGKKYSSPIIKKNRYVVLLSVNVDTINRIGIRVILKKLDRFECRKQKNSELGIDKFLRDVCSTRIRIVRIKFVLLLLLFNNNSG